MTVSVATAELIGTFLEMLGYGAFRQILIRFDLKFAMIEGAYLVVAPRALLAIRSKRLRRGLMIYLYATMILIFCLITLVSFLLISCVRSSSALHSISSSISPGHLPHSLPTPIYQMHPKSSTRMLTQD
jgi:hypothetical protein